MAGRWALTMPVVMALLTGACSSTPEQADPTTSGSPTSATPTSSAVTTQRPATSASESPSSSVDHAGDAPDVSLPEVLPAGTMLIATESGIVIEAADGTTELDVVAVTAVAGDGAGGLLFQQRDTIWWLAADEAEPRPVATGEPGPGFGPEETALILWSGAMIDGRPHALYVERETVEEGSVAPDVVVLDLTTGAEERFFVDEAGEGGAGDVWYGGGVVSAGYAFEGLTYFRFQDLEGDRSVSGPRSKEVEIDLPQLGPGVLSPDGARFLYLSSPRYRSGSGADEIDLVVLDLISGREEARQRLPSGDFFYTRIDHDGRSVLLSRTTFPSTTGTWLPVIEIEDVDQDVWSIVELDWAGSATFTR